MKPDRIMDALSNVKEEYILESAPRKKQNKKTHIRWIAAAIAVISILVFSQTAPGAAASEIIRDAITGFIETLFPPKDIPVYVEGETEIKHQEAGGQEPDMQEDGTVAAPGFAIYYDPELYTMCEENGITYIRFIADNELPPCEVEIQHIPDLLPPDAAEASRKEMEQDWPSLSEVQNLENRDGLVFSFAAGTNWDSACGNAFFFSDGRTGCFRILSRYFVEATEGHGARFSQMIATFEVIDPENTGS